jgi:hypothetical protein
MRFVNAVVGSAQDIIDDLICLSKIGVLPRALLAWSDTSDRMWFFSIHVDFIDAGIAYQKLLREKRMSEEDTVTLSGGELEDKLMIQRVGIAKLACDWVFCSYDVFGMEKRGWNEGWRVISALCSAVLGTYKLSTKIN